MQHPNATDTNYAKEYEYNVRQKYIVYAKQNHQIRQTKHQVRQKNTKYANQNTKYTKQNTKCAISIKWVGKKNKYWFALFFRDAIFVANLRTFLAYLLQA